MPSPSPVRRGLVASTWEGAFAQAFLTLTTGIFVVKFTGRLGGGDAMLGVLASVPVLATAAQLAGAWAYERYGDRRRGVTAWTLLASRLVWVVPAALALGWLPGGADLVVFLSVVAASAVLATVGAQGWQWWMADLVPGRVRGRYFGLRAAVAAFVSVAVGFGGGRLLDVLEVRRAGLGYAAVYALAAFAGLGAWVAIRVQHHPRVERSAEGVPFRALWRETWSKPEHRRLFAFLAAFGAGLGIAAPFWAKFMDAGLGMPTEEIALQGTLGSVVGVFLARPWGRLVDRVGLKRVFVWNVVAISGIPLLWVFPTRTFLLPVWADAVAVGVFWTGFNLALLTSALAFAPREGSAVFLGVYAAVFGVALGAACLVGGAVASALTDTIPAFGSSYSKYQVLFLASAALRAGAIPFVLRIPDPPGKPAAVGRALRPAASLTSRPAPGR